MEYWLALARDLLEPLRWGELENGMKVEWNSEKYEAVVQSVANALDEAHNDGMGDMNDAR